MDDLTPADLPARARGLHRDAIAAGWTVRATRARGPATIRKLIPLADADDPEAVRQGHNADDAAASARTVRRSTYVDLDVTVDAIALRCVRRRPDGVAELVHGFWWGGAFDTAIRLAPSPGELSETGLRGLLRSVPPGGDVALF